MVNSQRIKTALETLRSLSDEPFPHGQITTTTIEVFDCLTSTNQTLWSLLQRQESAKVVIAQQQTAGKGQWGRQWQSELGGLYLSLGLNCTLTIDQQAQLTMASAWGIANQLREFGVPVQLKWPNDLILNRRKLGGILTETKVHQAEITQAVVGVGLNWSNSVPPTGINLQSFLTTSVEPAKIQSIEFLAALVIYGLERGLQQIIYGRICTLLKNYGSLLTHLGHPVEIEGHAGRVVGVTTTGELRVQLNSGASSTNREIVVKPGTISLGYDSSGLI